MFVFIPTCHNCVCFYYQWWCYNSICQRQCSVGNKKLNGDVTRDFLLPKGISACDEITRVMSSLGWWCHRWWKHNWQWQGNCLMCMLFRHQNVGWYEKLYDTWVFSSQWHHLSCHHYDLSTWSVDPTTLVMLLVMTSSGGLSGILLCSVRTLYGFVDIVNQLRRVWKKKSVACQDLPMKSKRIAAYHKHNLAVPLMCGRHVHPTRTRNVKLRYFLCTVNNYNKGIHKKCIQFW